MAIAWFKINYDFVYKVKNSANLCETLRVKRNHTEFHRENKENLREICDVVLHNKNKLEKLFYLKWFHVHHNIIR